MTRRCRVVNILVRYRCNWSRSSILVSRSQLLTFLTVSGKCVFPLPSSLCCEVEFWTSWSHNSTGNLKTPKSAITRFSRNSVVVSRVRVVISRYDLSGHNIPSIAAWESVSPYLKKKRCNREGKKTYFGGLLSRFYETQNRLVLLVLPSVRTLSSLKLDRMFIRCLGQASMVYYDNSDLCLKWDFIGYIIYHNMLYKMKTSFPTIS